MKMKKGSKHSKESKEKSRDSHKGNKLSKESIIERAETRRKKGWFKNPEKTKEKMRISTLEQFKDGMPLSTRKKIVDTRRRNNSYIVSKETRKKMSDNAKINSNYGMRAKIHRKESIEKMRESSKGQVVTEETRKKISEANTGKKLTREHKRKISLANIGKEKAEGTRKKISLAQKGKHNSPKTEFKKGQKPWNKNLKGLNAGDKNPAWLDGRSFEPYSPEFNNQLKEKIRERDNYECQECHKKQEELNEKLSVHHIDYNKKNNNPLNLISLCRKCHTKTSFNRKHWKRYFQMQMFIKEFFNPENILIFNENKQLIGLDKFKY